MKEDILNSINELSSALFMVCVEANKNIYDYVTNNDYSYIKKINDIKKESDFVVNIPSYSKWNLALFEHIEKIASLIKILNEDLLNNK